MVEDKKENIEEQDPQDINWNRVYLAVELILATYIVLFYLLTNYFS